jgi:hypothetical protein
MYWMWMLETIGVFKKLARSIWDEDLSFPSWPLNLPRGSLRLRQDVAFALRRETWRIWWGRKRIFAKEKGSLKT